MADPGRGLRRRQDGGDPLLAAVAEGRVDELTRAGLLSWTPGRKPKPVGLLTRIPCSRFVTICDFSTVVTMGDREARARMFGMLESSTNAVYRSIGGQACSRGNARLGRPPDAFGRYPRRRHPLLVRGGARGTLVDLRLAESADDRARERARFSSVRGEITARREDAQNAAPISVLAAGALPRQLSDAPRSGSSTSPSSLRSRALGSTSRARAVSDHRLPDARRAHAARRPTQPARPLPRCARACRSRMLFGSRSRQPIDSVPLARMRALRAVADHAIGTATVEDVRRALGTGELVRRQVGARRARDDRTGRSREPSRSTALNSPTYRLFEPYRRLYKKRSLLSALSPPNKEERDRGAGLRVCLGCIPAYRERVFGQSRSFRFERALASPSCSTRRRLRPSSASPAQRPRRSCATCRSCSSKDLRKVYVRRCVRRRRHRGEDVLEGPKYHREPRRAPVGDPLDKIASVSASLSMVRSLRDSILGGDMPTITITTRKTASGERRYDVRYRLGGTNVSRRPRRDVQRRQCEAKARYGMVAGEIANGRGKLARPARGDDGGHHSADDESLDRRAVPRIPYRPRREHEEELRLRYQATTRRSATVTRSRSPRARSPTGSPTIAAIETGNVGQYLIVFRLLLDHAGSIPTQPVTQGEASEERPRRTGTAEGRAHPPILDASATSSGSCSSPSSKGGCG